MFEHGLNFLKKEINHNSGVFEGLCKKNYFFPFHRY